MTRILVTGANGFIGKVLCESLASTGHDVVACARNGGLAASSRYVHIPDIDRNTDWQSALSGVGVVIHLAARVHVIRDESDDPLEAFREVNLHGTTNLARQAAAAGVRRLVYVSSAKVNGEFTVGLPFRETDPPHPVDPYGISKWEAEQALRDISAETGMELVVLRPPLVYGPGVKANFFRLLELVDRSVPLPLGSVANARSMVYVGNLADALIKCAMEPRVAGRTYMVSDGNDISTRQLVEMIAAAMDRPCRIFRFPLPLMRLGAKMLGKTSIVDRLTQSLAVDSSSIRNDLTWSPPYTMAQGIEETVRWYQNSKRSRHD
jgi:nucleoside-diphosphate-sugar epimerase